VISNTQKHLVDQLKALRKRHGLTQEAFAEGSGFAYKYYQGIENGGKRDLRLSTVERLAKAYGIEVWQLVGPAPPETKFKRGKRGKRATPR